MDLVKEHSQLVSIIVPVYNGEAYLEQCLLSILKQDYRRIEVLIVDDGSIDESPRIARDIAMGDSRCRYICKRNGGVSSARNLGIASSRGQYVMFVDADDTLGAGALSRLMSSAALHGADVAMCLIDTRGGVEIDANVSAVRPEVVPVDTVLRGLFYDEGIIAGPYAKLIATKTIDGIRFDERYSYAEDLDFTYRVLSAADVIVSDRFVGYYYRQHPDSAMKKPFTLDRMDGIKACGSLIERVELEYGQGAILESAKNRYFMEAIYELQAIPPYSKRFRLERKILWGVIKGARFSILRDGGNINKKSILFARLAALPYVGFISIAITVRKLRSFI